MRNLTELSKRALEVTEKNVIKKRKFPSVNDSIIELLVNKKLKLTRTELIAEITLIRLIVKFGEEKVNKMPDDEFNTNFEKLVKTVKNGVDQSVSNAQNNASFNYKYKGKYKLKPNANNLYEVTKIS